MAFDKPDFNGAFQKWNRSPGLERHLAKVHSMWRAIAPEEICLHTNQVILRKDGPVPGRDSDSTPDSGSGAEAAPATYTFVVKVDNALIASEVNARREIMVGRIEHEFGYPLSRFDIQVSRGQIRSQHPFKETESTDEEARRRFKESRPPLSPDGMKEVLSGINKIKQPELRKKLEEVFRLDMRSRY